MRGCTAGRLELQRSVLGSRRWGGFQPAVRQHPLQAAGRHRPAAVRLGGARFSLLVSAATLVW